MKNKPALKPQPYDNRNEMRKAFSLLRASDREADQIMNEAKARLEHARGASVVIVKPTEA